MRLRDATGLPQRLAARIASRPVQTGAKGARSMPDPVASCPFAQRVAEGDWHRNGQGPAAPLPARHREQRRSAKADGFADRFPALKCLLCICGRHHSCFDSLSRGLWGWKTRDEQTWEERIANV
jgi:hypothetical protein